jgi:hypothetical protein
MNKTVKVALVCSGLNKSNDLMLKHVQELLFFTILGNIGDNKVEIYDIDKHGVEQSEEEKRNKEYEENLTLIKESYPFIESWNKVDMYLMEFFNSEPGIQFDLIFFLGCMPIQFMFGDDFVNLNEQDEKVINKTYENFETFKESFKENTKLFNLRSGTSKENWSEVVLSKIHEDKAFASLYKKFLEDFIFDPYIKCYLIKNSKNLKSISDKNKTYNNLILTTKKNFSDEKEYSGEQLEKYISYILQPSIYSLYRNTLLNESAYKIKIEEGMHSTLIPRIFGKIYDCLLDIGRGYNVLFLYKILKNYF